MVLSQTGDPWKLPNLPCDQVTLGTVTLGTGCERAILHKTLTDEDLLRTKSKLDAG
jgi:hypothetical protein